MKSKSFAFSNLRDPRRTLAGIACAWLALSGGTVFAELLLRLLLQLRLQWPVRRATPLRSNNWDEIIQ